MRFYSTIDREIFIILSNTMHGALGREEPFENKPLVIETIGNMRFYRIKFSTHDEDYNFL